jgi:branched-subunit amino acid ABC-type transport system permease component
VDAGVLSQAVISGLAQGAVYGLVALGFSLVHRLTRVLSFVAGDLVVGAVFVSTFVVLGTTPVVSRPTLATASAQTVLSVLAGAALSAAVYLLAIRPHAGQRAGTDDAGLGWVAASVAAGLVIREALTLAFPREAYALPDPLGLDRVLGRERFGVPGGGSVPTRVVGVIVVGLLAGVLAERYLVRSRTGKAMRAVSDDPDAATLMGIPRGRVVLVAFAVAGALAGLAGDLVAPAGPLSVGAGVVLGLKGVAAALLGGLGSLRGALVGGLVLGVAEAVAVASPALGAAYDPVLALAVLVVVLAVRPAGLRTAYAEAVE